MKFRPCIDLHQGKVKQIIGKTLSDRQEQTLVTNFSTDQSPAWFAEMYRQDNLSGGHVIMLGPGNSEAAIIALTAYPNGFHIGGGINIDNATKFLNAGASHVIVTSFIFHQGQIHWDNLTNLEKKIGKRRLVLDLSCKKKDDVYYIVTDRWQTFTDITISKENLEQLACYCDEFLIHAADKEGLQSGIDIPLIAWLADNSPIPVTYAGGVRTLADMDIIRKQGNNKIDFTVGSALDIFGGPLKYQEVVSWHKKYSKG